MKRMKQRKSKGLRSASTFGVVVPRAAMSEMFFQRTVPQRVEILFEFHAGRAFSPSLEHAVANIEFNGAASQTVLLRRMTI